MDDFGTGYASLSSLQSFPFDKIKIDRSFVSSIETNAQSAAIVRSFIGLGVALSIPVIAEGVETEAERSFLGRKAARRSRASSSATRCRSAPMWGSWTGTAQGTTRPRRVEGCTPLPWRRVALPH